MELIAEAKSGGDNFPPSHQVFMTVMMDVEFDTDIVMDDYGVIECSLGGEPLCHNRILILAEVGECAENHL